MEDSLGLENQDVASAVRRFPPRPVSPGHPRRPTGSLVARPESNEGSLMADTGVSGVSGVSGRRELKERGGHEKSAIKTDGSDGSSAQKVSADDCAGGLSAQRGIEGHEESRVRKRIKVDGDGD
jgi:hypothetical protein